MNDHDDGSSLLTRRRSLSATTAPSAKSALQWVALRCGPETLQPDPEFPPETVVPAAPPLPPVALAPVPVAALVPPVVAEPPDADEALVAAVAPASPEGVPPVSTVPPAADVLSLLAPPAALAALSPPAPAAALVALSPPPPPVALLPPLPAPPVALLPPLRAPPVALLPPLLPPAPPDPLDPPLPLVTGGQLGGVHSTHCRASVAA